MSEQSSVPDLTQSTLQSRSTVLLIRVSTDRGPRTVVVGCVTRQVASLIALALVEDGMEAAMLDRGPVGTVAQMVKLKNQSVARPILTLPARVQK